MRLPARFFSRKNDTHKGDYGHLLVVAGSRSYTGAAILCAEAAMRCGAGLVTLAVPESLHTVFACMLREVVTLPLAQTPQGSLDEAACEPICDFLKRVDACVIGPGLSTHPSTQRLVQRLIPALEKPFVIDADGLNALAGHLDLLSVAAGKRTVLTPHPGEFSRLAGMACPDSDQQRKKVAKDFALRYNTTLILKGYHSVVASVNSREVYVNRTGNPGMASGGCGDVLAGMVGALLVQGMDVFEAARWGTYLHGLSGDLAARELTQPGLIASDIIEFLPKAFKKSAGRSV